MFVLFGFQFLHGFHEMGCSLEFCSFHPLKVIRFLTPDYFVSISPLVNKYLENNFLCPRELSSVGKDNA